MSVRWRGTLVIAALGLTFVHRVAAQRIRREFGPDVVTLAGRRTAWATGVFAGVRPSDRMRLSLFLGGGAVEHQAFGRGELILHFLLAPDRTRGVAPYVAGGLAADVAADRTDARIIAVAGIEGDPGARRGWIVEAGVGGGWRVAAGWRWRR